MKNAVLAQLAGRFELTGAAFVSVGADRWQHGDVDAPFVVYSLTKSLIAAAFLALADQGTIDLDSSAAALLGDDRVAGSVREILTHTAGIPDYGLPAYHAAVASRPSQPWTDDELLTQALANGPDFAPGKGWAYSNTGYLLLRRLLDRHGGLSSFLPSLGLRSAFVAEQLSDLDLAVPAVSTLIGHGEQLVAGRYHPAWVGHRTVVASAREIHAFWSRPPAAFLDPSHFIPVGFDVPGTVSPSYGLGVQGDVANSRGLVISHGGGGPGYSAAAFAAPAHDAVAVVLEPREDFPAQPLAREMLAAVTAPRAVS
jgi:D-alanyl-D-alanine carboxypeptidase